MLRVRTREGGVHDIEQGHGSAIHSKTAISGSFAVPTRPAKRERVTVSTFDVNAYKRERRLLKKRTDPVAYELMLAHERAKGAIARAAKKAQP